MSPNKFADTLRFAGFPRVSGDEPMNIATMVAA